MTIIALLKNLLAIGRKLPAIIAILKSIIDVIGSDQVQKILEAIRGALIKESPEKIPEIPQTENQRIRIVKRLQQRLGLAWLGMSEAEYVAYCNIKNIDRTDQEV
jgi:hypothetical protein